jgi:hypothetical protein
VCTVDRLFTNPRSEKSSHLKPRMILEKEPRVSPPDFLPSPTQSDPAGHDCQRPDESARTAYSHDYNTWRPTRIGRFTSDDAQPV